MADVYTDNMTRIPSKAQRTVRSPDTVQLPIRPFVHLYNVSNRRHRNTGYVLHPSINLRPTARIVDLGTGTGIFLKSLQTQYPDAVLEGFDIPSELFPAPDTLPSKVSLGVLDIKQPFPTEMHGKYDLVHVRMLVTAMLPNEWDSTVRNLAGLLKPGGFLQWEECEFINAEYLLQNPSARCEKTAFIGDQFRNALRERLEKGWNTLPQDMSKAGLTSIRSDVSPSDKVPGTRSRMTASILSLVFTWARMMTERGAPKSLPNDELNKLQEEVAKEIRSGAYLKFNIHVACGQKPLQ